MSAMPIPASSRRRRVRRRCSKRTPATCTRRSSSTRIAWPPPAPYRGRHRGSTRESGAAYVADLGAVLEGAEAQRHPVGAFIVESAPGSAGQVIPPPGYLSGAFERVRAAGAVAIADEVQVGLGRVGSQWWAFEVDGAR